jgi:hypothetical protein
MADKRRRIMSSEEFYLREVVNCGNEDIIQKELKTKTPNQENFVNYSHGIDA